MSLKKAAIGSDRVRMSFDLNFPVVCAALRLPTGRIICGPRHYDPIMRQQIANDTEAPAWRVAEQGFVNSHGQFLSREDALHVAKFHGQFRPIRNGAEGKQLFSENLY